ncbi:1-deoxy-D-xylulose-5-phosphate synthase [Alkalicoccus urumqiensis]|uniref:1-deoxy-D-xylulose-5-phosphate synthase n=1 Tax=Alkalicoccus urumqiensis TaxID=1548213 RepID=A0A2P6MKE1_ALKUR|nr:1-deoxy-D-xylulose-5-phosphate synthase [Alkalicoccus urumqiensis]PRO66715.1 1-deoxy-D-xylulose-5-phosphate synthase [Alkalicoccus urumqiensis]
MDLMDIQNPAFLKDMTDEQLDSLAQDIRSFLIDKLSVTGGHLGPNLGVVELTLALHQIYDSPKDKFLFDVGHQAYVHKILTGRADQFDTLRQFKGLCGFPKRSESEHDAWETGHSSTSLSGAAGMTLARDLKGTDEHIIPIIGDGALTGGMAMEALNHLGHEQRDITIILNDNEMSIAPNVGAMHNMLGRMRTAGSYQKAKDDLEMLIRRVPAFGGRLADAAERVKDSLKYLLVSGMFFEELGFTYLGPVDGHDLSDLKSNINYAKKTHGPVLIHVVTKKGKGYAPAENDAKGTWHGLGPYKIESGEVVKKPGPPGYSSIFAETMKTIARSDKRMVAVTPAMPNGSGLDKFAKEFPERMFDVGIAEQHATTMSAGLALQGMKPVLAIYSTFMQRGYDQLVHDVCRQNANVVFAIDRAGLVGADGETHQGVFDISYMRHLPNMKILSPKDENEFQHLLYTAFQNEDGPTAVRYPRGAGLGVEMDDELKELPFGKWETLREGKDVSILTFGTMVPTALEACDLLKSRGIEAEVVNARSIKPLDEEKLNQLADSGTPIVTLEEHALLGGFGSAVLEYLHESGRHSAVVDRMGIPDWYIEHGSIPKLLEEIGLTAEKTAERAAAQVPKKQKRA